jgi:hypothetical protein
MPKIRERARTATPEELAEDRRRCLAAKAKPTRCAHGSCQREATRGGRYCEGHETQHATHGKGGRPELRAVADTADERGR